MRGEPDLVEERRWQAPYADRQVFVDACISPEEARFVVRDEGPGFDHPMIGSAGRMASTAPGTIGDAAHRVMGNG